MAFVSDAGVLGLLHPDLQLTELVGEPGGSLSGGLVLTPEILLDVGSYMRVYDARRELGISRFKTDVHQAAVRNPFHTETSQEFSELGRTLLVREAAAGDGFRWPVW